MELNKEEREKLYDKVRKLLALSTSPNEHEVSLAAEKAREILDRYQISMAEVSVAEFTEIVEGKVDTGYSNPRQWVHTLSMSTAKAFDCKVYRMGGIYVFCGLKSDTQICEYVFAYLKRTVFSLMQNRMHTRRLNGLRGAGDVQTYAWGVSVAIGKKIEEYAASQRRREMYEDFKSRTGKDLMVIKNGALDKYWADKGFRKGSRTRSRSVGAEYYKGYHDGQSVNINSGISGSANGGNGTRYLN